VSDPTKQVKFQMTSLTKGYPAIVNDHYTNAITQAKQGGDATQQYFDALNQTSDFWGWLAEMHDTGQEAWVDGTDPQGNPVRMASNGNIDMQLLAHYTGDSLSAEGLAAADSTPVIGMATVRTGNTTNATAQTVAFTISLIEIPGTLVLSKQLFTALLSPIYQNAKTLVSSLTSKLRQSSQVEEPDVDPEADTDPELSDASSELEDAGEQAAAEGIEYVAVDWAGAGLAFGGMAALAAIPMVISFVAHRMTHFIQINNVTDLDFTWDVAYQDSGKLAVKPAQTTIPKQDYYTDMFGDKTNVKCAYQANATFINSNDLGSIGYTLTLTPSDGGEKASLVVSIPWAGDNTIWVGQGSGSAEDTYNANQLPNEQVSQSATFGDYAITLTINKLSGKTEDQYAYSSLVVIEKAGS
jgi:hypothetical protein